MDIKKSIHNVITNIDQIPISEDDLKFKLAWRKNKSCVANSHPNSNLINLQLLKRFYAIEEALLLLGKDFTIERLKIRLDG